MNFINLQLKNERAISLDSTYLLTNWAVRCAPKSRRFEMTIKVVLQQGGCGKT